MSMDFLTSQNSGEYLEGKAAKLGPRGNNFSDWFRSVFRRIAAERYFMSPSGVRHSPFGQLKCPFKPPIRFLSWHPQGECSVRFVAAGSLRQR
jgi:hypothetical protein